MAHKDAPVYCDTVVLGAGIAGLACASRLLQRHADQAESGVNHLRILEARGRIGGRIASVDVKGCRLDTGANWIHGTGNAERPNPLMSILPHKRHRQLETCVYFRATDGGKELAAEDGSRAILEHGREDESTLLIPTAIATSHQTTSGGSSIPADAARQIAMSLQRVVNVVQDLGATTPAADAKRTSLLKALKDSKSFENAFKLVPSEYHHTLGSLFQGIESMEAAPLLSQSAEPQRPESQSGVSLLEYAGEDFGGEQAFLQDGYVALIEDMARLLTQAGTIVLEAVVTKVDWTRNPIIIETSQGTFMAKEVVCTFPLGVLKESGEAELFMPALPADKQEAIECLGFGTLDKVFAVYSKPWWKDEPFASTIRKAIIGEETSDGNDSPDTFMGFTSELSGISIDRHGEVSPDVYRLPIINLHNLTGQPVLAAFVSCVTATTVEEMDDEDVGGIFHRTLTRWFGSEPPVPDAIHVTRWAQDPYSRGAYSHMITGLSETKHREVFQEPVLNKGGATLRFAGEHCSRDHFAMVHGALMDGWRVADAIAPRSV